MKQYSYGCGKGSNVVDGVVAHLNHSCPAIDTI